MALILTYAQRTSMTGHGLLNYVLEAERAPDGAVVCVVDQVEHPDAAPGVHLRVYRGVMVKGPHVGRRVVIKGARTAAHLAHLQREAATYATLQHLQGDCIPHCVGLYTSPPTNEDAPQGCLVLVELDAVPSTAAALSQSMCRRRRADCAMLTRPQLASSSSERRTRRSTRMILTTATSRRARTRRRSCLTQRPCARQLQRLRT